MTARRTSHRRPRTTMFGLEIERDIVTGRIAWFLYYDVVEASS
jgi:hypothetical protein